MYFSKRQISSKTHDYYILDLNFDEQLVFLHHKKNDFFGKKNTNKLFKLRIKKTCRSRMVIFNFF